MFDSTMNREGKLYVFGVVIIHIFFFIHFTFHLNSNQNFKPFKMTDDRSLESISKFKISTSVT